LSGEAVCHAIYRIRLMRTVRDQRRGRRGALADATRLSVLATDKRMSSAVMVINHIDGGDLGYERGYVAAWDKVVPGRGRPAPRSVFVVQRRRAEVTAAPVHP
jgi:hypothetical protein